MLQITTEFKTAVNNGINMIIKIRINRVPLKLRISYVDKTRKNATYQDRKALQLYFEGFADIVNMEGTYRIEDVTDALLFAERKTQYLLEEAFRFEESEQRRLINERLESIKL